MCTHPTPEWNLYKTKKVWSFLVYSTGGSRITFAQINNTPHLPLYTLKQYMTTQVMNVFAYPCANVNLRDSQ